MKNKQYLWKFLALTSLMAILGIQGNLKADAPQAPSATVQTRPDGTTIQIESDGTKIIKKPDGTTVQIKSDGSKLIQRPDGTSIQIESNGTKIIKKPDGTSIEIKNPQGHNSED